MLLPATLGANRRQLPAQRRVLAGDEPEHHEVHRPDEQVGQGEDERTVEAAAAVLERLGDAQREHEHRGHPDQDRQLQRGLLDVADVGQPGVAGPGPPQQRQDQHAAQQPLERRVRRRSRAPCRR